MQNNNKKWIKNLTKEELKRAIVLHEILSKPKCLRKKEYRKYVKSPNS